MSNPIEYCQERVQSLCAALQQEGYEVEHHLLQPNHQNIYLRHRERGVRLELYCFQYPDILNQAANPTHARIFSLHFSLWLRTAKGGYACSQKLDLHRYECSLINYRQELAPLEQVILPLVQPLRGESLDQVRRTPPRTKVKPEPPIPQSFLPVDTKYGLAEDPTRYTHGYQTLARNGVLSAARVHNMGILLPRKDGRWLLRETTAAGPDEHLWFWVDCHSLLWKMAVIACDGESWHPLVFNHTGQRGEVLVATAVHHASHRDATVPLEQMTTCDQELIQAAINYYVTGQLK